MCGACAAVCPVTAISEGDSKYVVDPDVCIDCGLDGVPGGVKRPLGAGAKRYAGHPGPIPRRSGHAVNRTDLMKEVNAEFKLPRPHFFVEIILDQPLVRMCS